MKILVDVVLAIDPGRMKCGVAVVRQSLEIVYQDVVDSTIIRQVINELAGVHKPDVIVIGNGTGSDTVLSIARELELAPVEVIDEKFTTLLARKRFFKENPPKGLRRLIPISLQNPPRAFDDYVAVILAENYLAG